MDNSNPHSTFARCIFIAMNFFIFGAFSSFDEIVILHIIIKCVIFHEYWLQSLDLCLYVTVGIFHSWPLPAFFVFHRWSSMNKNYHFFSFTESPFNSLLTIKFPKTHITSSSYSNMPKTTIIEIQSLLGFRG
jgi:hypothetical protein